jgi:hypothetical protein
LSAIGIYQLTANPEEGQPHSKPVFILGTSRRRCDQSPRTSLVPQGLGLQWAVGMYLAAVFLEFGIQGLDPLYRELHHCLVAHSLGPAVHTSARRVEDSAELEAALNT